MSSGTGRAWACSRSSEATTATRPSRSVRSRQASRGLSPHHRRSRSALWPSSSRPPVADATPAHRHRPSLNLCRPLPAAQLHRDRDTPTDTTGSPRTIRTGDPVLGRRLQTTHKVRSFFLKMSPAHAARHQPRGRSASHNAGRTTHAGLIYLFRPRSLCSQPGLQTGPRTSNAREERDRA